MANVPLRNMLALVQKRFLKTSPKLSPSLPRKPPPASVPAPESSESSFVVQYLINSCGLAVESAISISKNLQIDANNIEKPALVLNVLKTHGFDDAHITKLIEKRPNVLRCKALTKLKPKLQFLREFGFSGTILAKLIVAQPLILFRSLDSRIKPAVHFLKQFIASDEELVTAIKRSSWLLTYHHDRFLLPNIELLIREGVARSRVSRLFIIQPRSLMQSYDRMVYAVKAVKDMGFEPSAPSFIHAFRVMMSMSEETWKRKVEVLKSLGWSDEDVLATFKKDPICLACSEEKLRNQMDFYMNTMKLDPKTIIGYPKLLLYSFDRRILPRYEILKVLESKKLIKSDRKIVWLLTITETSFLEEYITKYKDQVPGLLDMYNASINRTRASRQGKLNA